MPVVHSSISLYPARAAAGSAAALLVYDSVCGTIHSPFSPQAASSDPASQKWPVASSCATPTPAAQKWPSRPCYPYPLYQQWLLIPPLCVGSWRTPSSLTGPACTATRPMCYGKGAATWSSWFINLPTS